MCGDPMKSNSIAAAILALVLYSIPMLAVSQDLAEESQEHDPVAGLLADLALAPDAQAAQRLERSIYSEWSKSGSASADLLLQRGQAAIEAREYRDAIDHLQVATELAPDFAHAWHLLGLAYFQTDYFGPSMAALERALMLNPDHFGALQGVAVVNELVGNAQLAYQAYERAGEMRPHDSEIAAGLDRLSAIAQGRKA